MKCEMEGCEAPAAAQCEGRTLCTEHIQTEFNDGKAHMFRILLSDELEEKLEQLKDF